MQGRHSDHAALSNLLQETERELRAHPCPEIPPDAVEHLAHQIALFIQSLIARLQNDPPRLSRELQAEDLPQDYSEKICLMASQLASRQITDGEEAINSLREQGFEVREFFAHPFVPHDARLQEAPGDWLFRQAQNGATPPAITSENVVMICEVRPKPDVADDRSWIQLPYEDDPFKEELASLHQRLDIQKRDRRMEPTSRAGFTFSELEQQVLPVLSSKAGLPLQSMPALYACILANDRPALSNGRSTEWRERIGASHAIISGRSERGPIRYLYYDYENDPYPNRGFRVCAILGPSLSLPQTSP